MLKNKIAALLCALSLIGATALAYDPNAVQIKTKTSGFANNLSTADTDVQKALDTLDDLSVPTLARASISETVTGLAYSSVTGVLSLTAGYVIPTTTEETNWNTAYGWGDHSAAGYFIIASNDLDDITAGSTNVHLTTTLKSNYDTAYTDRLKWDGGATGLVAATGRTSLGLGSAALSSSSDFLAVAGKAADADKLDNHDSTYFQVAGNYITDAPSDGSTYGRKDGAWAIASAGGMVYPDAGIPLSTGSGWGTSITNNSSNWNTAYGWGNHASAGYLTSLSGAVLTSQSTGQTIGDTTNRLTKLWATDITCTNAIAADITGNAATVTNGVYTTDAGTVYIAPYGSTTAKYFLAAPNAEAGTPSFRAIVASDIPTLNQNTSGTAAGLSATLAASSGGTGVANNVASTITISGNYATTFTVTDTTGVTLPTTGTLATRAGTETFTNKRVTQRVVTTTDDSTAVIDVDVTDVYELSAVANATTFSTTGTPTDGQKLIIRFKDAGAAKGLTWDGVFVAIGVTAPTTTVAGKWHYVGCTYNSAASKWHILATGVQA